MATLTLAFFMCVHLGHLFIWVMTSPVITPQVPIMAVFMVMMMASGMAMMATDAKSASDAAKQVMPYIYSAFWPYNC